MGMLIMVLLTIVILVLIQVVATRTEQRRRTWRADALLERVEEDLDTAVDCGIVKSKKVRYERANAGTGAWPRESAR